MHRIPSRADGPVRRTLYKRHRGRQVRLFIMLRQDWAARARLRTSVGLERASWS